MKGYYFMYILVSSGELIHVGQINRDILLFDSENEYYLPSLVKCDVTVKGLSCGSNHTVVVKKI